jgi:hypothetical protein
MNKTNPTIYRVVGALTILIAIMNIVSFLVVFKPGGPRPQNVNSSEQPNDAAATEVVQDVGGINSPTGNLTLLVTGVMLVIGVFLLRARPVEVLGIVVLAIDLVLKFANIISQLATGDNLLDAAFLPVVLMVIDAVGIFLLYREWHKRRGDTAETDGRTAQQQLR